MSKPKLAIIPGANCAGCDYSLLDLGEKIIDVLIATEIAYWPTAADLKLEDLEKLPDGSIDIVLFEGAVNNDETEEMAKLARKKAKNLIAFGACACFGGIPGLANVASRDSILQKAYIKSLSTVNQQGIVPYKITKVDGGELTVPELLETVKSLDQVVKVDYYLPGCPPPLKLTADALVAALSGKLPPKGTVFGSMKSVCDDCKRIRENKRITEIKRYHQIVPDAEKCLLEQGIVCMGPATRGGCDAICPTVNIPCRGCMGPTSESRDQGARMLSALSSVIGLEGEAGVSDEDVRKLVLQIKDPLGTFYRYTLPKSIMRRVWGVRE
ncbi:MAG: oxidoreductase [Nitrososphaerota archaeon]|nr:oxidoreductase [Aigarchaeota archaeon]MDW8076496.1 oxidoreductase [Nitrososphaerota archaeon]